MRNYANVFPVDQTNSVVQSVLVAVIQASGWIRIYAYVFPVGQTTSVSEEKLCSKEHKDIVASSSSSNTRHMLFSVQEHSV